MCVGVCLRLCMRKRESGCKKAGMNEKKGEKARERDWSFDCHGLGDEPTCVCLLSHR